MKTAYATVIAGLECAESMLEVSSLLLGYLAPEAHFKDFHITNCKVTQWTNPDENVVILTDSGRFKYTANISVRFTFDGEYADVQGWIVSNLMKEEERTHMVIQQLDITMADYFEPTKDLYRENADL